MKGDTKLCLHHTDGLEPGCYLRCAGGATRWKTVFRVVSVDSVSEITIRWEWWRESWLQGATVFLLTSSNTFVWVKWFAENAS